jgi:hypothetical protein
VANRAPGMVAAVVRGNDTLLFKAYGKADVEWDVPMPADAMFEIGSVTKQFTAAAILQLRDRTPDRTTRRCHGSRAVAFARHSGRSTLRPGSRSWRHALGCPFRNESLGPGHPESADDRGNRYPHDDSRPVRVAVDDVGLVWYTDPGRGMLGVLEPGTGTVREFSSPTLDALPYGIAVAPDRSVWYHDECNDILIRFYPDTEHFQTIKMPTGGVARYIVADRERGRIWLGLSPGGVLQRIDASN